MGELPTRGPLAEFAAAGSVLSAPSDPARPWVLAADDRVIKAYDLRAFDPLERARAQDEADAALAASDIDGVVTTFRAGVVGSWLIIEMERLGESLDDYAQGTAAGTRPPPTLAEWGLLFEGVARALQGLHDRRLIHRDVKPANLMFDRAGDRLIVGDFSIASRLKRRPAVGGSAPPTAEAWGTDRYIAPEQFRGRLGYQVDQYALGVTAGQLLPAVIPAAAGAALARATEQEPEDRFPTVLDFGAALRSTLDETAPGRLSARLQRVSPKWRQTWALGAWIAVATYAVLFAARPANVAPQTGVLMPMFSASIAMLLARSVARLRRRTQPRVRFADRPWFPLAIFAFLFAAAAPLYADDPKVAEKVALYATATALAGSALLGSTQPNAGEWLVRLARRWEQWRRGHRGRTLLWWGGRAGLIAVVGAVSYLPAAVSERWPNQDLPSTAASSPPLRVLAQLRAGMLGREITGACRYTRISAAPGIARCPQWAPVAARWLRAESRDGRATLTPPQLDDIRVAFIQGSQRNGPPTWSLRRAGGHREWIGLLSRANRAGTVWSVGITRRGPAADILSAQGQTWQYEVVRRRDGWFVTSLQACGAVSGRCARLSQLTEADLAKAARTGPPR